MATKTTVSSFTMPLNSEVSSVPTNAVGAAVILNADITGDILRASCNGYAMKMKNFVRYGKESYTLGLPEGYKVSNAYNQGDVVDAIEEETGRAITLDSDFLDTPVASYWAEDHAQRNWGWRAVDSALQDPPITGDADTSVFLSESEVTANGSLDMVLAYTLNGVAARYVISVDLGLSQQTDYYHVTYHFDDTPDVDSNYWFYNPDDGTHPDLTPPDDVSLESPYLPIIPIRLDNVNMAGEDKKETELYITSQRLLKKISLEFVGLGEQIEENPGITGDPNNDDDKGIDHVFVIFGIDIRTERPVSNRYLYRFFYDLYLREALFKASDYPWGERRNNIRIQDSFYNIRIFYKDITSKTVSGSIGKVGSVKKNFQEGNELTLKYQLNESTYREIVVTELEHRNYVYHEHSVVTSLDDSASEENDSFVIPLNVELAEVEVSIQVREELYQESAKLIMNGWDRQKLKWYESSWFQGLLVVVAVFMSIWSVGTSIALLITVAGAYGMLVAILVGIGLVALTFLTQYTFEILAEKLGVLGAVLLSAVALYFIPKLVPGAFPSAIEATADEVLLAITSSVQIQVKGAIGRGINDGFTSIQEDIQDAMEELQDEFKILHDELEEMEKEMDPDHYLNPLIFTDYRGMISPNESPDGFYNRTIHTGNIGTLSLAVPESYVSYKLQLPEPNYNL